MKKQQIVVLCFAVLLGVIILVVVLNRPKESKKTLLELMIHLVCYVWKIICTNDFGLWWILLIFIIYIVLEYHCPEFEEKWPNKTIVTITAKIWFVSDFNGSLPKRVSNSLRATPSKRAKEVVKNNLHYLNVALAKSMIPIRYMVWGSIQDIGKKDADITGTSKEVLKA